MKIDRVGQKFGRWTILGRANKKGYWICRCDCGVEKEVQISHLKHGKGEGCKDCWDKKNQTDDLSGKTFSRWTVICKDEQKSDKHDYWMCRCDCGVTKSVYGSHLRLKKSDGCRKCSESKHKGKLNSRLWSRLLDGAKRRGLEVDLGDQPKEFLYDLLYTKQKCQCALTGLPIGVANTIKGDMHGETTASVDRIDSKKGYTKSNVQWVHKWINLMKMDFNQEEFITLCESVVRHKRGNNEVKRIV